MSPRADVSNIRKTQILDAATKVFARKGFDAASMDEVVIESGLSKGALYWYFKSKDQIITGLLDRIFDLELAELRALAEAPGSARERLLAFVRMTARQMKRFAALLPIAYEFYSLAFRNRTVKKAIRRYWNAYYAGLIPLVEQGIARGEFRASNAQEIVIAIGAAIEGTYLLWMVDPERVNPEAQLILHVQLILEGLSPSRAADGNGINSTKGRR